MKSDIRTIDLNNLDINNLDLPKEKFTCYVLCDNTLANIDLLEKIIQCEVKDINACGKYAFLWEECADNICIEYKNNGKKLNHWCITTENTKLDSFILELAFEHCEYYDDEAISHNPILLFYDDENLKNFVIKRVEWLLEDTTSHDPQKS